MELLNVIGVAGGLVLALLFVKELLFVTEFQEHIHHEYKYKNTSHSKPYVSIIA